MLNLTRGNQRQIADYLDEIADQKLKRYPLGSTNPMQIWDLSLGAAYKIVASDMRHLSDGEN